LFRSLRDEAECPLPPKLLRRPPLPAERATMQVGRRLEGRSRCVGALVFQVTGGGNRRGQCEWPENGAAKA